MAHEIDHDAPRPVRSEKSEIDVEAADDSRLAHADEKQQQQQDVEEHGKAWQTDVHTIPKNNLPLVFAGLILTTALASMDQTIVSTALPTITHELNGSQTEYQWVGTAYLLMATSLSPLYGKLSAVFGRKWVLFPSIVVFLFGSALCGAAQSMQWLCIARGVQGVGGGGILQLTQIVISDITPLATRGKYTSMIGMTWGTASVIGPLIGGALTDSAAGWRWCFFVNLPTGAAALAVLWWSLKLNPVKGPTFRELLATFDFLGLFFILSGVVLLLLGFNSGETSWSSKETIVEIVLGIVLLLVAAYVEITTKRSPIIPPRLFRTRTTACLLVATYGQSWGFIVGSYYLALYFQILGSSAIMSGVHLFPYSLGSSIVGISTGFFISWSKAYRGTIIVSFALSTLGYALLSTLDERSSLAQQEVYLAVAATCGALFQAPYIALQASMPVADMPASTSTLGLIRSLGGTTGISMAGTLFASLLRKRLANIEAYTPTSSNLTADVSGLTKIMPIEVRNQVLHAYTRSLQSIWYIGAPLSFVGLVLSCFLKHYALDARAVVRTDAPVKGANDGQGVGGRASVSEDEDQGSEMTRLDAVEGENKDKQP